MVRKTSQSNYTGISMPKDLMQTVDKFIKNNNSLDYKSRAEFVKIAVREKIENDQAIINSILHEDEDSITVDGFKAKRKIEDKISKNQSVLDMSRLDKFINRVDKLENQVKRLEKIDIPNSPGWLIESKGKSKSHSSSVMHKKNDEDYPFIDKESSEFVDETLDSALIQSVVVAVVNILAQKGYEIHPPESNHKPLSDINNSLK